MTNLRKFIVKSAFKDYLPDRSDFEVVEEAIPDLKAGEFLVRTEYISVDPYMRWLSSDMVPYSQFGFQVGKVVDSRNPDFSPGMYVVSHSGWTDHVVLDNNADDFLRVVPYQPDVGNLPISLSVGALGMPGVTAYLGLLKICKPNAGDVVCVNGAAGAVGSLVGQIAKLKGCTVIGFAGTDEKVNILTNELGFHYAFNYKTANIPVSLKSAAPDGIDCFFDNVGGDLASDIIENMKENGTVAKCGSISMYGSKSTPKPKSKKSSSVTSESFGYPQWKESEKTSALKELKKWLENGDIKAKETITNGFEELPNAFIGMLRGENIGKAIVKV